MIESTAGEGAEPSLELLDDARGLTELLVAALGGTPEQADAVASELVLAIAARWRRVGLARLAADPTLWPTYLEREICGRWLLQMAGPCAQWAVGESLARARLHALVEQAGLPTLDRQLFERVHLYGLSVAEAACAAGLEVDEAARRLRDLLDRIISLHPEYLPSS